MNWQTYKFYLILFIFLFGGGEIDAQDNTPPEKPVISYVTVDTSNNNVNIFWEKSPSPDVIRYRLYYEVKTPNGYEGVKFDSVPATSNSYTHITSGLSGIQPILYSVSAVDDAGNESIRKPGLHSTIHTTVTYDSCNSNLTLRWNKYQGWGNSVSGYLVYERKENGSFDTIAGQNASDTSFVLYEIPENKQFHYFVVGVNFNTLTSFSNIASKYTYMPLPPEELHLDYVTVTGPNTVDLQFRFSESTAITDFALLKSNNDSMQRVPVKSYHSINSSPQIISDSILTSKEKYFYRIGALNTCGVVISTSNLGTNILLSGSYNDKENLDTLFWNSYNGFPHGTDYYEIFRLDTDGNSILLGTLDAMGTRYIDDLSTIMGQNYTGKIIYRVRAVEKGTLNQSFSNFLEIQVKSEVWKIPNAFTPNGDGKNDIFTPQLTFFPNIYLFLIYDRNGFIVFESTSPDIGWDGRIRGNNYAPAGVYIYHVQYVPFNGVKVEKTGHVTVFYP